MCISERGAADANAQLRFGLSVSDYCRLVGEVVAAMCAEDQVTHPGDIGARFAVITEALDAFAVALARHQQASSESEGSA